MESDIKPGINNITLIVTLFYASFPVSADFKTGGDAYKMGDYETAAKEFLPLAEGKDHRAMSAHGSMYAAGHGVPMDLKEALRWFRKAASYERPDAQYKLGLMYNKGPGLTQDYRKALGWYGKSAKNGFGPAQYKIGQIIAGNGVKQNFIKAFAWLKTAISQGANDKENILENLTSELTPVQLTEANSLTRQYLEKYTVKH